ncbi:MAG: hypothetical protein ACTSRZ_03895 [Promethearchaeota archaeon]
MAFIIKGRAEKGAMFGLLFLFLLVGISQTRWEANYIQDWEKLDIEFSSINLKTSVPHIINIGDIDNDLYPEILLFDGIEKSIVINDSLEYKSLSASELINRSVDVLKEYNYFEYYGRSSIGVYSLVGEAEYPQMIWNVTFNSLDIFKVKSFAPNVNNSDDSETKKIILSAGRLLNLPDLKQFGYSNFVDLFKNNHLLFNDFFTIDHYKETLVITPKYTEYLLIIMDALTGQLLSQTTSNKIGDSRCFIDITPLNQAGSTFIDNQNISTKFVIAASNISLPRLISPLGNFLKEMNKSYDFAIYGFNYSFTKLWEINPQNLRMDDYFTFSGDLIGYDPQMHGNTSIYYAKSIKIEPFGSNFILRFVAEEATIFDEYNTPYYGMPIPLTEFFMVYNGSNGNNLWKGDIGIKYITKDRDINGNGFGQVNGFYTNGSDIYFLLFDPIDGELTCKAKVPYNASRFLNNDTINDSKILITDDDALMNDSILELYIVTPNVTYLSNWKQGIWQGEGNPPPYETTDAIQIIRLNLNPNGSITMVKSIPDLNSNVNLKKIFEVGWDVQPSYVDFDKDGVLDYIIYSYDKIQRIEKENIEYAPRMGAISGICKGLHYRNFAAAISTYVGFQGKRQIDFRQLEEVVSFFHNPKNPNQISSISANPNEIIYIQDLNTFDIDLNFMQFFKGSKYIIISLIAGFALCAILVATGVKKKPEKRISEPSIKKTNKIEDDNEELDEEFKEIIPETVKVSKEAVKEEARGSQTLLISTIIALITMVLIEYFFAFSVRLSIGYTDIAISSEGSLIWFIIIYPSIFAMMAIIPDLYSVSAPFFAEKVFINSQKSLYKILTRGGKKDYKVIVINFEEKIKINPFTRLSRLMLPLLMSITIGLSIYQQLSATGSLYSLLESAGILNYPLTNPDVLGIWTENMTSPNDIWVEMGKFALYCVLPIIITYLLITVIVPPSWLLDDAGVLYYEKAKKYRELSDVDSIGKWMLSFISGIFGFTAITSFFSLFIPMFNQLGNLMGNLAILAEGISPIFSLIVIILALVVYPFLFGVLLIISAHRKMEHNYFKNAKKLYIRLEKKGISTTPKEISAILKADVPQERLLTEEEIKSLKIKKKYRKKRDENI